jgi:hypothetical protein
VNGHDHHVAAHEIWDPRFRNWTAVRSRLDHQRTVYDQGILRTEIVPASADVVASFVHKAIAGQSGIPVFALGTSQQEIDREAGRVAG